MPKETFTVPVTQFLRPNGRQQVIYTELPIEVEPAYNKMVAAGCRFETEVLTTDQVSTTISDGEQDIWIHICQNGPRIQEAMVDALKKY